MLMPVKVALMKIERCDCLCSGFETSSALDSVGWLAFSGSCGSEVAMRGVRSPSGACNGGGDAMGDEEVTAQVGIFGCDMAHGSCDEVNRADGQDRGE